VTAWYAGQEGIIDARARYRATARLLRNTAIDRAARWRYQEFVTRCTVKKYKTQMSRQMYATAALTLHKNSGTCSVTHLRHSNHVTGTQAAIPLQGT
jgi:hypothetical protein